MVLTDVKNVNPTHGPLLPHYSMVQVQHSHPYWQKKTIKFGKFAEI